jgi:hypothetical protein
MSFPPPNRYAPLADPPPRPPRRRLPVVLGLVAGLIIGGGGVGLGWLLSSGPAEPSGPAAEAAAACTAIRGAALPAGGADVTETSARRWVGAGELAGAAAAADPRYRQLGDALGTVEHAVETLDTGSDRTQDAVRQAQAICEAN